MNNEIKCIKFFLKVFSMIVLCMTSLISEDTFNNDNSKTYKMINIEGSNITFYLHELEGYEIEYIDMEDARIIQSEDIEKDIRDELTREISKIDKNETKISDLLSRIDTTKWLHLLVSNDPPVMKQINKEENSQLMYTLFEEVRKNDRNQTKILEILSQVADIDMPFPNRADSTLLYDTVQREDVWMCQKLLEYGARMGKNNSLGENPSSKAISHHVDKKILKIFFENGLDPNRYITKNQTILAKALWNNKYEKIKLIIDSGADVNLFNDEYYRPIKFAIQNCKSIKIIKLLIDSGANTDGVLESINPRSFKRCKHKDAIRELLNNL